MVCEKLMIHLIDGKQDPALDIRNMKLHGQLSNCILEIEKISLEIVKYDVQIILINLITIKLLIRTVRNALAVKTC